MCHNEIHSPEDKETQYNMVGDGYSECKICFIFILCGLRLLNLKDYSSAQWALQEMDSPNSWWFLESFILCCEL